jgi:hypothetical protein
MESHSCVFSCTLPAAADAATTRCIRLSLTEAKAGLCGAIELWDGTVLTCFLTSMLRVCSLANPTVPESCQTNDVNRLAQMMGSAAPAAGPDHRHKKLPTEGLQA